MKNLLLTFAAALAFAQPLVAQRVTTNAARISGNVVRAFAGRTVNVPWGLRHTGTVSGVQFDLSYPADKLITGVFQPGTFSNNVVFRWRQLASGQQRVLFYTKDGSVLTTNLFIGNLPMTVPAGDYFGGGPVTISSTVVARTNAVAAAPVALAHGGVTTSTVFRGENGVVDLIIFVQSNHLWVVQATTNFVNWVNIATNSAIRDFVVTADNDAPNYSARFYRALLVGSVPGSGGLISSLSLRPGNQLTFGYATTAGRTYILEASTNLASWNALTTNLAGGSLLNFTNMVAPAIPKQFFRIRELP